MVSKSEPEIASPTIRPFGIATMSRTIDLVSFVSEGRRRPPQMLRRCDDPQERKDKLSA